MGSGCGTGGKCVALKTTRRLNANQHRPFAHASPSLFSPPVSAYNELSPERAAKKLKKWQAMCGFKLNRRQRQEDAPVDSGSSPADSFQEEESVRAATEESCLAQFAEVNPRKFSKRLISGPPSQYRWVAWKVALKVSQVRVTGIYQELCSYKRKQACPYLSIILQDRDRTFAQHVFSRESLENVLVAYSAYDPVVGYCQGMNYLAGFLLIVSESNEEEAFWALVALIQRKVPNEKLGLIGIAGFYTENFPQLRTFLALFDCVLSKENDALKLHLSHIGLPNEIWLQQWISSLFLYSFPKQFCVRFWDGIFASGMSFVLAVSYTVVNMLAPELMRCGMDSCYSSLKGVCETHGDLLGSPDEIVNAARKVRLDWKVLETVREECGHEGKLGKTPQGSTHPTDEDPLKSDDANGSGGENIGRTSLLQTYSDNSKALLKSKREEFKLPPIKKNAPFVFEFNSEVLTEGDRDRRELRLRPRRRRAKYTQERHNAPPFTFSKDEALGEPLLLAEDTPCIRVRRVEAENLEPEKVPLATDKGEGCFEEVMDQAKSAVILNRSASRLRVHTRLKLLF